MPLDPHLLDRVRGIPVDPDWDSDRRRPENERVYAEFFTDPAPYALPASVEMHDEILPGPHGRVPVRLFRPRGLTAPAPALLWNHGGGFAGGDLDMNESQVVGAELAARSGALVVSVGYRLAIQGVRHPVPLDDVEAAWTWLRVHAGELGVDRRALAVGGGSAGANLAAALVVRLLGAGGGIPSLLLLAYPALHFPLPALDDDVHAVMAGLPPVLRARPQAVAAMFTNYAGRISDLPHEVTPGHAALEGFPATRILISEYDDFRPSGELFAEQLTAARVPLETHLAEGMLHGHLNRTPALPEVARSLDFFAEALAAGSHRPGRHGSSTSSRDAA